MRHGRTLVILGLVLSGGALLARCGAPAAPPAPPPTAAIAPADLFTVKELMEHVIDPQADGVFNAISVVVDERGTTEHRPRTDEDWAKVQRSAVILAEAANLLKMPREMAPPDDPAHANPIDGPELPPNEIARRVDRDRALWNRHADALRDEARKVLAIVKARDADKLFDAGASLDTACEGCHLEYWYPGDREIYKRLGNEAAAAAGKTP